MKYLRMGKLGCMTFAIYINCSEIFTDSLKPCRNKTYSPSPHLFPAGTDPISWPPQKGLQGPGQTPQISGGAVQAESEQVSKEVRWLFPWAVFLPMVLQMAGAQQWMWQFSQNLSHLPIPLALPEVKLQCTETVNPSACFSSPSLTLQLAGQL